MPLGKSLLQTSGAKGLGDIGPITIGTSTEPTVTGFFNQKRIDRTSNNVLWTTQLIWSNMPPPGMFILRFRYSLDDGVTWNTASGELFPGGGATVPNWSFFIDLDDYIHVAYKHSESGLIYHVRGTPNAARTDWTWGSAFQIGNIQPNFNYPDLVAFRSPSGSGWEVCIVWSRSSSSNDFVLFLRLSLNSSGTITDTYTDNLSVDDGAGALSGKYDTLEYKYPSIDFHHTGDGKTVADGAPHLFVGWHAGDYGSGLGLRFRKAAYSGGSWSWNSEREIYADLDMAGGHYSGFWFQCIFNGLTVGLVGFAINRSGSPAPYVFVFERDIADTVHTLSAGAAWSGATEALNFGSSTYDADGNIYVMGRSGNSYGDDIAYHKITRDYSGSYFPIGPRMSFVPIEDKYEIYAQFKRGYSNGRLELIYTSGDSSPYDIVFFGKDA